MGLKLLATLDDFLGAEISRDLRISGLGAYFAYSGGGLIADDIERGRMDFLLSLPLSRAQLLTEKFGTLLVPMLALSIAVTFVVYAGVVWIGESIDLVPLVMGYLLSVPYLLAHATTGTLCSALVRRGDVATRLALGLLFVLYLVDSVAGGAQAVECIQYGSATYYYDPAAILVERASGLEEGLILVVAAVLLFTASQVAL